MINDNPIGFLDSGLGGLTIWNSVRQFLPYENTIYVGDHAYIPYGKRKKNEIQKRVYKIISFLTANNAKIIVIACNTATVAGIDEYRIRFPQIPIIGVVPVVKTAAQLSQGKPFAVLATDYTINSKYHLSLIKNYCRHNKIINIGSTELVKLIETDGNNEEKILKVLTKKFINMKKDDIDILALGCTHFPFIQKQIQTVVGKNVKILDSGTAVAKQVDRILNKNSIKKTIDSKPIFQFFTTGDQKKVTRVASKLVQTFIGFKYVQI